MTDAPDIRDQRRQLGQDLRSARLAAGFSQARLARRAGYARSTVSTVESGGQQVPRRFWELCDAALGTGTTLASASEQLDRRRARPQSGGHPERRRSAPQPGERSGPPGPGRAGHGPASVRALAGPRLTSEHPAAALAAEVSAAYQRLGWRAEISGDRVELVCGTAVEALEVPRAPGLVAARWWLHTGGAPDEIRGLPALPDPAAALAVIAAGDRWFFLVQAGACPWSGAGLASAALPSTPAAAPLRPGLASAGRRRPGGQRSGRRASGQRASGQRSSGQGAGDERAAGQRAPDRLADKRAGQLPAGTAGAGAVVRWHAAGSRIPAPPSRDISGQPVSWAHPPPARLALADPVILLDLLARAIELAGGGDQPLRLPGGIVVAPAAGPPAARAAG
jgi:transcriptional regulator with XRE-family HTH domain